MQMNKIKKIIKTQAKKAKRLLRNINNYIKERAFRKKDPWCVALDAAVNEEYYQELKNKIVKDPWSSESFWSGDPRPAFPFAFKKAKAFLEKGNFSEHLNLLVEGLAADRKFSRKHELDQLGLQFFRSWAGSIGKIGLLDIYIKMRELGLSQKKNIIILESRPANTHYLYLWQKYTDAIVTHSSGIKHIEPLAERLEVHPELFEFANGEVHYYPVAINRIQTIWEAERRPALLSLRVEDQEKGFDALTKIGLPKDGWFVTFQSCARSGISCFQAAADKIIRSGGWVVDIDGSLPKSFPRTIKYGEDLPRTEWMSSFIFAKCRFLLTASSASFLVPASFGIPVISVNCLPLSLSLPLSYSVNIGLPKICWSEEEKRALSLVETLDLVGEASTKNIRYLDNTSDEISEAVQEMLDRISNGTVYDVRPPQSIFDKAFLPFQKHYPSPRGSVAKKFLERHPQLLEPSSF